MKRVNKRGSMTMAFLLFVMIMGVSMQFMLLGNSQNQAIARHSEQFECIYSYGALADIIGGKAQETFSQYRVKAPKDNLSGINAYATMAGDLRGKFIIGLNEYALFTPEQLIQNSSPVDESTGKFLMKLLQKPSLRMSILVEDLFVPDLNSDGNILNYVSGDKLYFKPYTIEVTVSDVMTTVIKTWEVRGVYADISISGSEVIMRPNFSQSVMLPRSSLYS